MFKKIVAVLVVFCMVICLAGCGQDKTISTNDGKTKHYEQIGLFELDEMKSHIQYDMVAGNVVWSIILSPLTAGIGSFILLGWYLYEPVGVNHDFYNEIDRYLESKEN